MPSVLAPHFWQTIPEFDGNSIFLSKNMATSIAIPIPI